MHIHMSYVQVVANIYIFCIALFFSHLEAFNLFSSLQVHATSDEYRKTFHMGGLSNACRLDWKMKVSPFPSGRLVKSTGKAIINAHWYLPSHYAPEIQTALAEVVSCHTLPKVRDLSFFWLSLARKFICSCDANADNVSYILCEMSLEICKTSFRTK